MVFWRRRVVTPLVIDFGTQSTKIFFGGRLLFCEPTVLAKKLSTGEVVAVGESALKRSLDHHIEVKTVLKNGRVQSLSLMTDFIKYLHNNLKNHGLPIAKNVLWSSVYNYDLNLLERGWFGRTWQNAEKNPRYLFDQGRALSSYVKKKHHLQNTGLLDIGYSGTRLLLVSEGEVVYSLAIPWGMFVMEEAIKQFLSQKDVWVSNTDLNKILKEVVNLKSRDKKQTILELRTGADQKLRQLRVTDNQLLPTVESSLELLLNFLGDVLTMMDTAFQSMIKNHGLILVGGGANLTGVDQYLSTKLAVSCQMGIDASYANIIGLEEVCLNET